MRRPTQPQRERLVLLAEECAEVIHAVTKILRHGYDSGHPRGGSDNREDLERECGNLRYAMVLMTTAKDIDKQEVHRFAQLKSEDVREYLHDQPRELLDKAATNAG